MKIKTVDFFAAGNAGTSIHMRPFVTVCFYLSSYSRKILFLFIIVRDIISQIYIVIFKKDIELIDCDDQLLRNTKIIKGMWFRFR